VSGGRLAGFGAVALLAAFSYLHGLSSPHIPKNGDEYPYTHITRKTAESGRLLPLCSELPGLRNTKPPLLFWQGIVTTGWGRSFDLLRLRYPSVVYTLLTALLLVLLGQRVGGSAETGLVAGLCYLAFFSTYRYGRPFLTNAPEVFWLLVPLFVLLYGGAGSFASRLRVPVLVGVATGIGLLYKSFALAVPCGLGLALLHWRNRRSRHEPLCLQDLVGVALTALIALLLFATWLLADPDPGAVFREFVVGENLGKLDPKGSYLTGLLWGRFSVPSLALGFLGNAGLLAPLVVALCLLSLRRRDELREVERMLWAWILAFFVFFCVPSQRSSRYLLPVMPALALLLALSWDRIRRFAFVATLALAGAVLVAMMGLSLALQDLLRRPYGAWHFALLAAFLVAVGLALFVQRLTRPLALLTVFSTFLAFSSLVRPLDGELGRFDADAVSRLSGRDVWVPVDFVAKEEGYRFLLPGARVQGYSARPLRSIDDLLARYPRVVARQRVGQLDCTSCRQIGERLDLGGRHSQEEIREMLAGRLLEHLLVREVVVERVAGPADSETRETRR
jgi:4-amino-4-deoxy-L-arabinose transferase-like glycosyltransferase